MLKNSRLKYYYFCIFMFFAKILAYFTDTNFLKLFKNNRNNFDIINFISIDD